MKLKENCYRIRDEKGDDFLKLYKHTSVLRKVKLVHDELCAIHFPYVYPVSVDFDLKQLRQQWVNGQPANYQNAYHRIQVYEMLKELHRTNEQIDWTSKKISRLQLKDKWQKRLNKFLQLKKLLYPFLQEDYDLIVEWAEEALEEMNKLSFTNEYTLLHGDVVHHNFLLGKRPFIIDFDLAIVGHPLQEEIMFVQRVLPMMRYEWHTLLKEIPSLKKLQVYAPYIHFPNELLREWGYFAEGDEKLRKKIFPYVQQLTKEAKMYRKYFIRQLYSVT